MINYAHDSQVMLCCILLWLAWGDIFHDLTGYLHIPWCLSFFPDDLSCHVIGDTNTEHGPYNEFWKVKTEVLHIIMNLTWTFITYMQFIIHQYLDTAKGKPVNQQEVSYNLLIEVLYVHSSLCIRWFYHDLY